METIRITASTDVLDQIRTFLKTFKEGNIRVENESDGFLATKKYLQNQIAEIDAGRTVFYSIEEADAILENTIRKHEG
jgi:hypothetical protein